MRQRSALNRNTAQIALANHRNVPRSKRSAVNFAITDTKRNNTPRDVSTVPPARLPNTDAA
jgi:hypothetical protein